jgi:hypothetical protein
LIGPKTHPKAEAATGAKPAATDPNEFSAHVDCKVKEAGTLDCAITETQGTAEVDVCWESKIVCESGAKLGAARPCARVKNGGTTNVTIPADKIKITGECRGAKTGSVENLTYVDQRTQPK